MSAGGDDRLIRLYGERREMLTRYLTARLGSREEAEDAVQEVFLKLHRADLTKSLKNPGAFLFRAATNVAIDIIRQRQRARHRDRDWTEAHTSSIGIEPVSEQPDAEAVIDAKARLRAIVQALEDLSPRVRQVTPPRPRTVGLTLGWTY